MRSAFIYLAGEVVGKLSLFILFPIYGHYLSVADFGVVSILFPTVQTLQGALGLGLPLAMLKYYYDLPDQRGTVYYNALCIWGTAFVIIAATFFLILQLTPLSEYQLGSYRFFEYSLYLVIALLGYSLLPFAAQIFRAERRPLMYVGYNTGARVLILTGVSIYLVFFFRPDALGVIQSIAAVAVIMFVAALAVMIKKSSFSLDEGISKQLLYLGLPQVVSALSGYIYMVGGRLFLNDNTGAVAVGVFGMVHGLVLGLSLLIAGFGKVYVPELFQRLSEGNLTQEFFDRVARLLLASLLFAAVVVQFTAPWLLQWMGKPEYMEGQGLFPVLLMTVLFQGAYIVVVDIFAYFKRTGYLAMVNVSISIFLLILVAWLTPEYGYWGLAAAQVCAAFIQPLLLFWKIPSLVDVKLPYKMWFSSWAIAAVGLQVMHRSQSLLLNVAILTIGCLYFVFVFRKDKEVLAHLT